MIAVNERTPNMPRFETVNVPSRRSSGWSARRRARVREARVSRRRSRRASCVSASSDDGHEQRVVGRDRDPDVDARVALDRAVDVRRVEARKLAQRRGGGLDDEVVERRSASPSSARAPRRSAAISDMSTSAETVKTGIVVADSTIRRAIVACVAVSSTMRASPSAGGRGLLRRRPEPAAAFWTSSRVIRPPGPVPAMPWSETPSSTAVRRATGVAFGRRRLRPARDAARRSRGGAAPRALRPARRRSPSVAIGCADRGGRALGNEDRVERRRRTRPRRRPSPCRSRPRSAPRLARTPRPATSASAR